MSEPLPAKPLSPLAWFSGTLATGLAEVTDDPAALGRGGWWAVVHDFDGRFRAARFTDVRRGPLPTNATWDVARVGAWTSSLDRDAYTSRVDEIRARIARGDLYQVNLCRVLSAPITGEPDILGLAAALQEANPAPYLGVIRVPGLVEIATASPELFLHRRHIDGEDVVDSGPVKGTAVTAAGLKAKDYAENVMIVDLVRNDLGRVAVTGGVTVPALTEVQPHPGLVHLVSVVRARLRPGTTWAELLAAASPPGSVSGAPKEAALAVIDELEPSSRGPYCGAVGWVDADTGEGVLAVAIRSFWLDDGRLHFGTGAGITWGSDPVEEWDETRLKARRLLTIAAGPSAKEER